MSGSLDYGQQYVKEGVPEISARGLLTGQCIYREGGQDYTVVAYYYDAQGNVVQRLSVAGDVRSSPAFGYKNFRDYRFLNLLDASTRTSLAYAALSGYDARHSSACGQLTGTRSYVADAGGQYIASAIYYDAKGRPVQQHTTTLRGGYERSWLQYRFAGGVQRLRRHHYDPSGGNLVSSYRYAYDSCERLTAVYHTLGDGQEVCLSTLSYDAYGRLGRRTLHGGIHSSTYSYNIRDWLTGISGPKFTQNLYYNTGSGTPCWNGNISSMTWQAGSESTLRGYKFAYDGLNRLTSATYGEGASIGTNPNRFTEKVTGYDKQGNIKSLQRYGQTIPQR